MNYQPPKTTRDSDRNFVSEPRFTFLLSFFFVFFFSFSLLSVIGLVPESGENATDQALASLDRERPLSILPAEQEETGNDFVPRRVVIESVDIDTSIQNPESRDIQVLDDALLQGAVHYPGSGLLDDRSNMFLFGHSSFLPTVNNQNFRAFNNLEKVKEGDLIRVESTDTVNIYRVVGVRLVDASEALVELGINEKKLTLSTCNSFGSPSERFVVEADFVGSFAR
jgi:LPXTG-site transpeptidase (sortase) family protein